MDRHDNADTDQDQAKRLRKARCAFVLVLLVALVVGVSVLLSQSKTPLRPSATGMGQQSMPTPDGDRPLPLPLPPEPPAATVPTPLAPPTPGSASTACPVRLDGFCYAVVSLPGEYTQAWRGYSTLSCGDAAEQALLALRDDGWTLQEHGYIDLFGDAWSCIVSRPESGEVLMVTVMPLHKYEPAGQDNPMTVSVVCLVTEGIEELL
jgi:hypothetical protein